MRASWRWLCELSGVDVAAGEMAERLTGAGLEVESVTAVGGGLPRVVVAEVRAASKVPERDKLTLVRVFDGESEYDVVCGAPNVPAPGGRVVLAQVGATLPGGLAIAERKLGGVVSRGMICSEVELEIGAGEAGIIVLGDETAARPGTPVVEALALRDFALEIGLTPNRPDCLGHVGLAREVALLHGVPFRAPVPPAPPRIAERPPEADVEILDPDRCPRYGAALIAGVTIAPSPFWLRYRLHVLGLRSIHNVVDATNLVMMEHGHPTHAFDLARVGGSRIVVRAAREGEQMKTLDGVLRTFTADDLLICDAEHPVAVAGVMGGEESEIAQTTENVLLECAYFDPRSVRRTSRRLGLHTDASHRFERGIDPNQVPVVMARCAALIAEVSGGAVAPRSIDRYPKRIDPVVVTLRPARATKLLGYAITASRTEEILRGIGGELERAGDGDALRVTVPTWRPDITREADLIEELARVHGYDHVPTEVPHVRPSKEGTPRAIRFVRDARQAAAAAGLHEALTYSFVARRDLEAARVPTDAVPLSNPLSEEREVMRTSLLPGLARAVARSQSRQVDRAALFEVGHVFHRSDDVLPIERRVLAVLLSGPRRLWIGDDEPFDFYDGRGMLEAIVRPLAGTLAEMQDDPSLESTAPFLHPARRAAVLAAGAPVGVLGELHPDVADDLGLVHRAVYGEVALDDLLAAAERVGVPRAEPLPRFPAVLRDIAMVVPDAHPAAAIAGTLREAGGGLVEDVRLFDLYRGAQVPDGHRSLAFRVVYRDPDETLTDKRVEKVHQALVRTVQDRFGATIR